MTLLNMMIVIVVVILREKKVGVRSSPPITPTQTRVSNNSPYITIIATLVLLQTIKTTTLHKLKQI